MDYEYEGKCIVENDKKYLTITFNVWEVCEENVGSIPVHVNANDLEFDCKLSPINNGYYNIPLTDAQAVNFTVDHIYPITFTILGQDKKITDSPYSYENPIRKITDMNVIIQPWDGLCGQASFAMLAGITIEEAGNIMHCREWQANMAKIVPSLDYVGIRHAGKIVYTNGKPVKLPKCCIIMEKLGRFSHYLIGFDGQFYDPNDGILKSLDPANIKGYLEILTD
ncbi:MAG: DUF1905 domain-containing protein [Lachnospiraceae bacterium]|nr:DUF1905 domain-containing protein [Lachnospiraceae bacterium]